MRREKEKEAGVRGAKSTKARSSDELKSWNRGGRIRDRIRKCNSQNTVPVGWEEKKEKDRGPIRENVGRSPCPVFLSLFAGQEKHTDRQAANAKKRQRGSSRRQNEK